MTDSHLETYFKKFRNNTIGYNHTFESPYGTQTIHYFDWTASGRLYRPIEKALLEKFGPFVGNTHSETSETALAMTASYHLAQQIIKRHVNANDDDVLVLTGTGTTGAINKLQRILGLKYADQLQRFNSFSANKNRKTTFPEDLKPVVFITQMEHHSNQISWLETNADVVIVPQAKEGPVDIEQLHALMKQYRDKKIKIGSFIACSNVTGVLTPYDQLTKIMHQYGGYCFVDFAASAPYLPIDMHPTDPEEKLDAIFFSPHKFLGGPGTPGVLIFDKDLYPQHMPPETPGGGTVMWTNPWGGRRYNNDIEIREDAGTPGFLQTIKAALCIKLKEEMGTENITQREKHLLKILLDRLREINGINILEDNHFERTGIVSFTSEKVHYNLLVKLLNDRYGIQIRGGCACAGTYGHCLLHVDQAHSKKMTDMIDKGDQSEKVGWARISLHPTLLEEEVHQLIAAIKEIIKNVDEWEKDYLYNPITNEFRHKSITEKTETEKIKKWFEL